MKIKTLRIVLLISIGLLVISEIFKWMFGLMGGLGGFIGGLLTAAVFFYCGIKARAGIKYSTWILVPTILFTIIPTVAKIWKMIGEKESSFFQLVWQYGPYLLSFVLPVLLLLYVYLSLGKHLEKTSV